VSKRDSLDEHLTWIASIAQASAGRPAQCVQQCGTEGDGGDAGDHWKHWEAKVRNGVLDLTGVRECDKLHIRPVDSAERSGAGETACGGGS
jgi:hypothetical protein